MRPVYCVGCHCTTTFGLQPHRVNGIRHVIFYYEIISSTDWEIPNDLLMYRFVHSLKTRLVKVLLLPLVRGRPDPLVHQRQSRPTPNLLHHRVDQSLRYHLVPNLLLHRKDQNLHFRSKRLLRRQGPQLRWKVPCRLQIPLFLTGVRRTPALQTSLQTRYIFIISICFSKSILALSHLEQMNLCADFILLHVDYSSNTPRF